MADIHYLLYASSSPRKFDDAELADLLALSRRNNEATGISGMLLYADGNFIQYIEGPADKVTSLYRRIGEDPRHRNLTVLVEGDADRRRFPDWSMGYRALDREKAAGLGRFELQRDAVAERLADADHALIVALMTQFYDGSYPYAD